MATFFIALGLAMDAFAVSISNGVTIKDLKIKNALKVACFFGGFQAVMPIIGWLTGLSVRNFIAELDHWIAFGLLGFIGCKMIYESLWLESEDTGADPLNVVILIGLSIATSIDALAVGITFAFLKVSILGPILLIGAVTFVLSFLGVYIGNRFGHFFERKIEIAGGAILILIGIKILTEHLSS